MTTPADSRGDEKRRIIIGRICAVHGIRGWLKVFSYTKPKENIFSYTNWLINNESIWESREILDTEQKGNSLLVLLDGVDDRESAKSLIGADIAIYRDALPALAPGEYYWCDLLELDVINQTGNSLGKVVDIQQTGANDVLVVAGDGQKHLIPLVQDKIVREVDLDSGRIRVDWNTEYL